VLSCLTTLLHSRTPTWLREPITQKLSSIPLLEDQNGVRTTITFFLGKKQEPSIQQLDRIGQVVGSIPTWISADEYISRISSQVISLLDDRDAVIQRVATHILAHLVLKDAASVEKSIFNPIREPLSLGSTTSDYADVIFEDTAVERSLSSLERIVLNPSPSLVISLLQPVLLNLFLLLAYTQSTPQSYLRSRVLNLMHSYLTASSAPLQDLLNLNEKIFYVPEWTFAPGGHGGVEIRRTSSLESVNLEFIQFRIESLLEILEKTSEATKSEVFVGIVRKWLSPQSEADPLRYIFYG
jgi:hypothetical protein